MLDFRTIRVGGIAYSVEMVKGLTIEGHHLDGHIDYGRAKITIDADLCDQLALQTIWHETIHAILTQAGIVNIKDGTVDALAFGIIQVLRDNPDLRQ